MDHSESPMVRFKHFEPEYLHVKNPPIPRRVLRFCIPIPLVVQCFKAVRDCPANAQDFQVQRAVQAQPVQLEVQ